MAFAAALGLSGQAAHAALREPLPDLSSLSLEELADLQVTSVSKRPESVGDAPSAIYVISHDDILRSGQTSVPEMLRLAPNLQVSQAGASRYVVTARGFNGSPAAQNYSNKLLVLIDGRSVYSPLFSGVYWDMQSVTPQDIDRIEVISGPGATLWGANAVNGVINIITRSSAETQGGLVVAGYGDQSRTASLRFGGRAGEALTYRLYASTFQHQDTRSAAGASNNDHWSLPQVGFRADWTSGRDTVTVQADAYRGFEAQAGAPAQDIRGDNLTSRWTRSLSGGSVLQAQAYYDRVERGDELSGTGFTVDTYDLDLQYSASPGRHEVVWGGGYRTTRYRIAGSSQIFFEPPKRKLNLLNAFIQDTWKVAPNLTLVAGVKLEDDPYVKATLLPTARLTFRPADSVTVWAAASRAVRAPTPFDRDVVETLGGVRFLNGGGTFRSEKLVAYELGLKLQPSARVAAAVSGFYNDFDDLRSIEVAPGGGLPLRWGNQMTGRTYGVEAWGRLQVTEGWLISAGVNYLDGKFRFRSGSSRILGPQQAGNDPKFQAQLTSAVALGRDVTLSAALRHVSPMPEPRLPAFTELNGRLGWALNERVLMAVSGRNLLHRRHREYPGGAEIPRSVYAEVQWRF